MCHTVSDHYSHRFIFKMNKLPARATDRFSRPILYIGIIFGLLLIMLGSSYFISNSHNIGEIKNTLPVERIPLHTLLSYEMFCGLIALVGFGVISSCFVRLIRYKKILFDGKTFTVTKRSLRYGKETFEEPLYNYAGVRLRVKFYQYGLFTKNKFIIELYHKDPQKTIPLYISTRSRSIRRYWKNYAQELKMPALRISEKGMVSYNALNLDKPYKVIAQQWHLPKDFLMAWDKPSYITLRTRKTGEKMIKISKVLFDAYSILALCSIAVCGSLLGYALTNSRIILEHLSMPWFAGISTVAAFIIIYALLKLLSTDIIILARNKVILFKKSLFFKVYKGIIHINDIKGIDINYIPTLNRYYLAIISNQETLIFGEKMPAQDLRWIRAVLIGEIIAH